MSSQQTTPPSTTSFREACEEFLAELERAVRFGKRSPATLAMHRIHVPYLYEAIAPTTPIAQIDERVINSCAVLESQGRRRTIEGGTRPTTTGTVAKRICTLRMVLELAHRRGQLHRMPAFPRFPGRGQPRREFLRNPGELEQLAAALGVDQADWIFVAVFTGQHPSDVERMRAYLDADPFASPPWVRLRNTKNRHPEQLVVMPAPLATRLREVFDRRQLAPGAPVVIPWDKDNRSRTLRKVGRRLGLLLRRATDCRHTCASWVAHEQGTITVGLKDWLGHSSMEMLSRVYAHALPPAMADVAAALTRAARRPPRRSSFRHPGSGGGSSVGNSAGEKKSPGSRVNGRRGR